jgi:hypothetical protein
MWYAKLYCRVRREHAAHIEETVFRAHATQASVKIQNTEWVTDETVLHVASSSNPAMRGEIKSVAAKRGAVSAGRQCGRTFVSLPVCRGGAPIGTVGPLDRR